MIVGGFNVLHMGHINLFRFSKKHVDILVVGLDNDKTLENTKGVNRPVNNYKRRSNFISELISVDYVFKIDKVFKHGDKTSFDFYNKLFSTLPITHVFTSIRCDNLWREKKKLAKENKIKFIPEKTNVTHTSDIHKALQLE